MTDQSHLDMKYFIDENVYNCPFCNRNHVCYTCEFPHKFDWSNDKACHVWTVQCDACGKKSMHLTYEYIRDNAYTNKYKFKSDIDIDNHFFYSVPSSFFVVDNRIPRQLRELITEASGCIKMNYMTGASACTRKAIYELLVLQEADGEHYDDKIKDLQGKHPDVDSELFEILAHVKDMTSDKVHEQSWDKWDSPKLTFILETVKTVLHEIYVVPDEKSARKQKIRDMKASLGGAQAQVEKPQQAIPVDTGSDE